MTSYRITNKAIADLTNIYTFTFQTWSEKQADLYYAMLVACFQEIADRHLLGKQYREVGEDIFGVHISRHIVFYRSILNAHVEIIRVLHDSMDIKTRMRE
jgi:toxin ParE1/3/4